MTTAAPSSWVRLCRRQHLPLVLLSTWLIVTSPWLSLLRRIPDNAGLVDYAHVVAGCATAGIVVLYAFGCLREGGWRSYFPWLEGKFAALNRDVRGLLSGLVPGAEAGGLFAVIEGLLLASLLVSAATGVAWLILQGDSAAIDARTCHLVAARAVIALLTAHLVTVSLHVLEFLRD